MYFQPLFPYYKFTRQETLHSSTTKLLLQYFITIWLSPMGNEQMRKLKNIFSERRGRSSFIRLHQSYDPTKKEQNFVGSPPSCLVDVLHEAKVDEKAFIYLVRKRRNVLSQHFCSWKGGKMTQMIIAWQNRSYLIRQHSGWKWSQKDLTPPKSKSKVAKYFMDFESAPHDIFMNGGLLTIIAHLPAFLIPTMDFAIFQLENSKKGQKRWDKQHYPSPYFTLSTVN